MTDPAPPATTLHQPCAAAQPLRRLRAALLLAFGAWVLWLALASMGGLAAASANAAAASAPATAVAMRHPGTGLLLQPGDTERALWDHATVLADPSGQQGLAQVMQRTAEFRKPAPPYGNLGRRDGAVWLRVPLQRAPGAPVHWLLDLDYPPLDSIDVYVVQDGHVVQHALLGDHVPMHMRTLPARSHLVALALADDAPRELWVRVQSVGTLLVPARLATPEAYQRSEAAEQALQGVLAGVGLCLLVYTLAQWAVMGESIYALYGLAVLGTVSFFGALSGVGPQHVWGGSDWLTRNAPPLTILLGVCGAVLFIRTALQVPQRSPRLGLGLLVLGVGTGVVAALFACGQIGYVTAQSIGMALGPTPLLLVLPLAWRCARNGDRTAPYLLLGWGVYAVGALVIVALLAGWLPLNFWTLHGFQFATLFEMGTWMLVLGERAHAMRLRAAQALGERDKMRSLAQTDGLTGLLNRRGLEETLPALLAERQVHRSLALFLLDLDAFKEVNDTHGHAVGDALLRGVARRLQETMREPHTVCRLGGDEFVVVVTDLSSATSAAAVGMKLLRAFDAPVELQGVGNGAAAVARQRVTIGYALAPQDAQSLTGLLKCADAGLYAGKQAGKQCLRRGAVAPLVADDDLLR